MDQALQWLAGLVGPDEKDIGAVQMAVRAVLVYSATLVVVRAGNKRLLGRSSALDFIVAIMLGSIMSRAVNAGAPLLPTVAAGAALVAAHWGLAVLAYHSDGLGWVLKSRPRVLVKDGVRQRDALARGQLASTTCSRRCGSTGALRASRRCKRPVSSATGRSA